MQARKYLKSYFLLLIFVLKSLTGFGQKPPTGGNGLPPLPPNNDKSNFPIIYPVIGLGVAGLVYYLVKKHKPQQVFATESLKSYLLKHSILPTTDAFNLMYLLNPELNNSPIIPKKFHIKDPDFPNLSEAGLQLQISSIQRIPKLKISFDEQSPIFKSQLKTFQSSKFAKVTTGLLKTFTDDLETIQQNMQTSEFADLPNDPLKKQMVADLFHVLNQLLNHKNVGNKVIATDVQLVKSISDNLNDLLTPPIIQDNSNKQGFMLLKQATDAAKTAYSEIERNASQLDKALVYKQLNTYNDQPSTVTPPRKIATRAFAFAIYKLNEAQKPVLKGAEIEGKYFVQYVCPALKDFQECYHDISPPLASYAGAYLPSAKFYISVKDLNNKPLKLMNPLIDTRDEYEKPDRVIVNKMVKIIINVQ